MAATIELERSKSLQSVTPESFAGVSAPEEATVFADQVSDWLQGLSASQTETYARRPCPPAARYAGSVVLPHAVRVQDLPEERAIQSEYAAGLGRLTIGRQAERIKSEDAEGSRISGLKSSVEHASRGNRASLEKNAKFALTEALTNEGVMPDLLISRDADGQLQQDGQLLFDVLANGIELNPGEHHQIHDLTRTNAVNLYALDEMDKAGYFDRGNIWVVPSLVAQGAPGRAIRRYGNFENLDVAWQFIWKDDPDKFRMRTMFTAGVDPHANEEAAHQEMTPAQLDHMFQERLARRHDIDAVRAIYEDLGLPVPDDVPGFLRGFLMHKNKFSDPDHPEADMALRYDNKLGPEFYLGRRGKRQDYVADGQKHAQALRNLHTRVPAVVEEMIARRGEFKDDMSAARMLYKIASRQAVDHVIDNPQVLHILGPALGQAAYNDIAALHAGMGGNRADIHRKARPNTCGFGESEAEAHQIVSDQLSEDGTGNKSDEKTEYKFDKEMYCLRCQAPPKEGAQKKMCGPCGYCRDCDKVLAVASK